MHLWSMDKSTKGLFSRACRGPGSISMSVRMFLEFPSYRRLSLSFLAEQGILVLKATASLPTSADVGVTGGEKAPAPSTDARLVGLASSPPFEYG